jgi:hypothetical protein
MKKLIFAVLVVLLAMLTVTCDSAIFSGTGAGPGAVGPVEPGMVTLDINVAESRERAMVGTNAPTDTDFYEVVFVSPTTNKTYRQTFNTATNTNGDGTTGSVFKISVPEGNYDNTGGANTGTAILFAGKNNGSEKTLLGAGMITAISTNNGTPATGTTIASDTTGVTITVNALSAVAGTITSATTSTVTISGSSYTAHAVATGSSITATYTITATTIPTAVSGLVNIATGSATIVSDGSNATVLTKITGGTTVTSITPASGTLSTTNTFTIGFTSPTTDTWSKLWMQVPVTTVNSGTIGANGSTFVSAGTWYLRGGINNTSVDTATPVAPNDKGGAILLKVGNPETMIDITITVTP